MMGEMVDDQGLHGGRELQRRAYRAKKLLCDRPAGRLVAGAHPSKGAPPLGALGCRRLSEIVREDGEHQQPAPLRSRQAPRLDPRQGVEA